jgi:4'-phosphopantetheinyl transferase EntD
MSSLRSDIAALFPPEVKGVELSAPELAEPLFPEEELAIARAVEKRRIEFALGRTAARRALGVLGVPPVPLIANADRSVAWPAAAWGSITHADGLCAAVAALREHVAGLGIDAEVKDRVHQKLWNMIATEHEQKWLAEPTADAEQLLRAALLFSAKEAFYKAQFCVSRTWVGFHDAETEFDAQGNFQLKLLSDVGESFARGMCFSGKFTERERHVVTGLVISSR